MDLAALGAIPTVGKRFKILHHYQTAIVRCECEAKTILVLMGQGQAAECPACGKQFAIANAPTVTVGILRESCGGIQ
jgi:uncharacterized paraquat-inducible protein A